MGTRDDNNQDSDEEVGGGGKQNSASNVFSSAGNRLSLIESVAESRLSALAATSHWPYPKQADPIFIKHLAKAGLAQVMIGEDPPSVHSPLVVSTTLVRFLISLGASGPGLHRAGLQQTPDTDTYYVELDQEIYDAIESNYKDVLRLASFRADIFWSIRQGLNQYLKEWKQRTTHYQRYMHIGGEALRHQVSKLGDRDWLRDNYPLTDDVDVLMQSGSIEDFMNHFPSQMAQWYRPKIDNISSMLFSFPSQSGSHSFQIYKVKFEGQWQDFMPSLDLSFPHGGSVEARFGDDLHILYKSIGRALNSNYKRNKLRDRVLFARALFPDDVEPELLYLSEFPLPKTAGRKKPAEPESG